MRALVAILLLTGCRFGTPPEGPPTPVECGAHVWGDNDGDGIGYRLHTTRVRVLNTSGYPLDLASLGNVVYFDPSEGDFEVPMVRVNEPGNGWLGMASVWVQNSTGIIQRAEVKMNEAYSAMADPLVATHVGCMEVLHTAGLAHQPAADSCMSDCSESSAWGACMRDPAKQTPNNHDMETLAKIYDVELTPPTVCAGVEFTLLTFKFPAPGQGDGHGHE